MNNHPASAPATDRWKIGMQFLDEGMRLKIAECDARRLPSVNSESRPLNPGEQHLIERHLHRSVKGFPPFNHIEFTEHETAMLTPPCQGVTLFLHAFY
jgi:hypothetical protein